MKVYFINRPLRDMNANSASVCSGVCAVAFVHL